MFHGGNSTRKVVPSIWLFQIISVPPLPFVTDMYTDFNTLLNTRSGTKELMRNFETIFYAQVSRFNEHNAEKLPESLLSFMLLSNFLVEDRRWVSILAASVGNVQTTNDQLLSEEELLAQIKYSSIASVLRQCDRSKTHINKDGISWTANQDHT